MQLCFFFPQNLGRKKDISLGGELYGVAQKIVQNLEKPHAVSLKFPGNLGIQMHLNKEILFFRYAVEHHGGISQNFFQIQRELLQGHLLGLNLGEIQNIVDGGDQ